MFAYMQSTALILCHVIWIDCILMLSEQLMVFTIYFNILNIAWSLSITMFHWIRCGKGLTGW